MALILNIDTATEAATICLAEKDKVIDFAINESQKDHASFLQVAIRNLLRHNDLSMAGLDAIGVTSGPGSYTGLRVGMASAKGLCYALNIPLITISTLQAMALSSIKQKRDTSALYCPMIDARRMEVFTAVYDHQLTEIIKPCAMILNETSFSELLKTCKIYFSGNGALKLKELPHTQGISFIRDTVPIYISLAILSWENYKNQSFSDLFYTVPTYIKELYTPKK